MTLIGDPLAFALRECITLLCLLRKQSRTDILNQQGLSIVLGGGSEFFSDSDISQVEQLRSVLYNDKQNQLVADLLQLRSAITKVNSVDELDSVVLLDPFIKVIEHHYFPDNILSTAISSIKKFLRYKIIDENSGNFVAGYRRIVFALITSPRLNKARMHIYDELQINIIQTLEDILCTPYCHYLTDRIIYDTLSQTLSIICKEKVNDSLKVEACHFIESLTVHIFDELKQIDISSRNTTKYINSEDYSKSVVVERHSEESDSCSENEEDNCSLIDRKQKIEKIISKEEEANVRDIINDPPFGVHTLVRFLALLHSIIKSDNRHKYLISTQIFSLRLVNIAIEIADKSILDHPELLNIISDPIFKSLLFILENDSNLYVLFQPALDLFVTLLFSIGKYLPNQVELTLTRLFILIEKNEDKRIVELILEACSILWIRHPTFFANLFLSYDCNLEREDLCSKFFVDITKVGTPNVDKSQNIVPFVLDAISTLLNELTKNSANIDTEIFSELPINEKLIQRARKSAFIKCVKQFNKNTKRGITELIENRFIQSPGSEDIASFLFDNNSRVDKKQLGLLLCKPTETDILSCFMDKFDFQGLRVDEALRVLLTKFRLPGESQQIERIIESFSTKYVKCQSYQEYIPSGDEEDFASIQPDSDSVFILSYSIIMLNTDLHNPQVKEHMTLEEYSSNLKGCYNKTRDYPKWFLHKIFASIRDKEIVMPEEHHGNEMWFDDIWNNLVSSTSVVTEIPNYRDRSEDLSDTEVLQIEVSIFEIIGKSLIEYLFKLINAVSDDDSVIELINLIEKCIKITNKLHMTDLFNFTLENLSKVTTLINNTPSDENNREDRQEEFMDIPLVDFELDNKTIIPISPEAVKFGKLFKGQMALILYFKAIKKLRYPDVINSTVRNNTIDMMLLMFNKRMLLQNIEKHMFLPEGNMEHHKIAIPKADITVKQRIASNRNLLSTFASYLKGDAEPSEEDINYCSKAIDCIKMIDFKTSVWENSNFINEDSILWLIDDKLKNVDPGLIYLHESEILFIIDLLLILLPKMKYLDKFALELYSRICEVYSSENVSKEGCRRLTHDKIQLIEASHNSELLAHVNDIISKEIIVANEIYDKEYFESEDGKSLAKTILDLCARTEHMNEEPIWKLIEKIMLVEPALIIKHIIENSNNKNFNKGLRTLNNILKKSNAEDSAKIHSYLVDLLDCKKEVVGITDQNVIGIVELLINEGKQDIVLERLSSGLILQHNLTGKVEVLCGS